jgi:hypothetical protein
VQIDVVGKSAGESEGSLRAVLARFALFYISRLHETCPTLSHSVTKLYIMDHRAAPATHTHGRTYDRVVGLEFALGITTASHLRQPQDAATESDINV